MAEIEYVLGKARRLEQLFPAAKYANTDVGLSNIEDVIAHYTKNSMLADGFNDAVASVRRVDDKFHLSLKSTSSQSELDAFAHRHAQLFGKDNAGKAIKGKKLLKAMNVWNPMEGYHVNRSSADGKCKWNLFPPLGLNVMNQAGVLLMHYPPWQVLQQGTFLDVMTMNRWNTVLMAAGVPESERGFYRTIVDINPIAAPGSGQSEYPNDYFPIMMASGFFDRKGRKSYIRSMLEFYLNGPKAQGKKYTLPLIICGSPLYDPQAPGWFRAAYPEILPQDKNGVPLVDVLQTGSFKLFPDSERETPYMIANHMIAAGVTGACTQDPSQIPDIRMYEAQDLVAASFLHAYKENPDSDPLTVKQNACQKWFGNETGLGPPQPPSKDDAQVSCALAQMDLFFEHGPPPHPKYTFEEALKRCGDNSDQPCCGPIAPTGYKMEND